MVNNLCEQRTIAGIAPGDDNRFSNRFQSLGPDFGLLLAQDVSFAVARLIGRTMQDFRLFTGAGWAVALTKRTRYDEIPLVVDGSVGLAVAFAQAKSLSFRLEVGSLRRFSFDAPNVCGEAFQGMNQWNRLLALGCDPRLLLEAKFISYARTPASSSTCRARRLFA